MNSVTIWGIDAGDFVNGKLIWSALNSLKPAKVHGVSVVDLSGLQLARPYTIASIAALGCLGGRRAAMRLPRTHDSRDYVVRSGLTEFFRAEDSTALSPSPRIVVVRQLDGPSSTFADEISSAWEREFGGMPVGLRSRLADHLDEMIRNALSHANSPIGCIVAAQVYPSLGSVEITVLDLGRTIRGHLASNPLHSHLQQDADAILHATQEGVTGTPAGALNALGEPNSGVGLYELRLYCESGGGELAIVSGESMVTFGVSGRVDVQPFRGGFAGTLVNMRFRVDAARTLGSKL